MKTSWLVSASFAFAVVALPNLVRADVIPDEVAACQGKAAGDHCPQGACTKSTCTRLDYANWDRDASAAPPSKTESCLKCLPADDDAGADTGSAGKSAQTGDAGHAVDIADGDAGMHVPVDVPPGKKNDGGCTITPGRVASDAGPWLLAGSVGLLLSLRPRRKR
jgi:hypothetical protein